MSRKYEMNREDAKKFMESEVRWSSFWTETRNQGFLQEIIDVLYNSVEGNDYVVERVQNQNGERLKIVCNTCKTDLSSYDPFVSHENGKSHKKILQQILCPKDPNLNVKLERNSLRCSKGTFSPGTLEDDIDTSEHDVIGVHFLYKELINEEERFTCTLCMKNTHAKRITREEMLQHLLGIGHPTRYLEKKFGYSNLRQSELKYRTGKIVEQEGFIHTDIVDFTKQIVDTGELSGANAIKKETKYPRKFKCKLETQEIPRVPKVPTLEKSVGCVEEDFKDMQQSLECLKKKESIQIVAEDGDMQSMLIHFNWFLADRLVKYYEQHSDQYVYYKDSRLHVEETAQKRCFNATKLAPYVFNNS